MSFAALPGVTVSRGKLAVLQEGAAVKARRYNQGCQIMCKPQRNGYRPQSRTVSYIASTFSMGTRACTL
jgi:hypothetical protein